MTRFPFRAGGALKLRSRPRSCPGTMRRIHQAPAAFPRESRRVLLQAFDFFPQSGDGLMQPANFFMKPMHLFEDLMNRRMLLFARPAFQGMKFAFRCFGLLFQMTNLILHAEVSQMLCGLMEMFQTVPQLLMLRRMFRSAFRTGDFLASHFLVFHQLVLVPFEIGMFLSLGSFGRLPVGPEGLLDSQFLRLGVELLHHRVDFLLRRRIQVSRRLVLFLELFGGDSKFLRGVMRAVGIEDVGLLQQRFDLPAWILRLVRSTIGNGDAHQQGEYQ